MFDPFAYQLSCKSGVIRYGVDGLILLIEALAEAPLARRLEALLIVADKEATLMISGNGDVMEPEHEVMAIGSGGSFAQAAAQALVDNTELPADEIVQRAMKIAADICIYTNHNLTLEVIGDE